MKLKQIFKGIKKVLNSDREAQDKFIGDYITPLFCGKGISQIVENYRNNQTERVYNSLSNLAENGTSYDAVQKDILERTHAKEYGHDFAKRVNDLATDSRFKNHIAHETLHAYMPFITDASSLRLSQRALNGNIFSKREFDRIQEGVYVLVSTIEGTSPNQKYHKSAKTLVDVGGLMGGLLAYALQKEIPKPHQGINSEPGVYKRNTPKGGN